MLVKYGKTARSPLINLSRTTNFVRCRQINQISGDIVSYNQLMGMDFLKNARLNKGMAFTMEERQQLGIHGLQPACIRTQDDQLKTCKISIDLLKKPLNKYGYLMELRDRNERLFYRFLWENIVEFMPIVYTPTVGLACQRFGLLLHRPIGLFITIHDRGHILDVLKNWPEQDVNAICVTDGERILGLGDLGANGMGIPVGKLALYTVLVGVRPHKCLPITLDVGTNNQKLLKDPLYLGLRQKRVGGKEYEELLDEFMDAVVKRFGQNCLIQFEDFAMHNALKLKDRYRDKYCTFNDDIQGTAAAAVAGLYASERITGTPFVKYNFLFAGAGSAATGIAELIMIEMIRKGVSKEEAVGRMWMTDSKGLLTTSRKEGLLLPNQKKFVKEHEPMNGLEAMVKKIKPEVLIGVSGAGGIFTPQVLKAMAANHKRPIVYAMSNPTSKAECSPKQAYDNTEGRVIFATGSPFPPVEYGGKTYVTSQANNAYIFPGIAMGIICSGAHHVPEEMFLKAAEVLAGFVEEKDLERGSIYPPLTDVLKISLCIAVGVAEIAYKFGLASTYPEPKNKVEWIQRESYQINYTSSLTTTWKWPTNSSTHGMPDGKSETSKKLLLG